VFVIDNPHSAGMFVGWLPDAKMAFNTDLWITTPTPPTSSNPNLAALIAGVEKWGLQPEKMSGGHGTVADYAAGARVVHAAQGKQ
jgi:hypothetical protein